VLRNLILSMLSAQLSVCSLHAATTTHGLSHIGLLCKQEMQELTEFCLDMLTQMRIRPLWIGLSTGWLRLLTPKVKA